MNNSRQRVWLAWMSVGLLVALCGALAVLQYRWIGKTTEAERSRLHGELHLQLDRLARALNAELTRACAMRGTDGQLWFRRAAVVDGAGGALRIASLDRRTGKLAPMEWPAEWASTKESLGERLRGGGMGPPPRFDAALVVAPANRWPAHAPPNNWLVLELDMDYVRGKVLPQLLARYLAVDGKLDYDWELATDGARGGLQPDDSIALLDIHPTGGPGPGPESSLAEDLPPPPPPPDGGRGRWRLFVRHSAGSLEALVEQTRRRNLAISAGVLLLILATAAMLAQFTRRAQQLAAQQVDFVAGVSHELRTPLTVIRTAAFNLRGKLAARPDHVERYGALIQAESEKLEALVEQALRFASVGAGHTIGAREPISVRDLLSRDLRFDNGGREGLLCVDRQIADGLPEVMGDPLALRQAIQNLVDNAVKYGACESRWIGLQALVFWADGRPAVEIRVADRGPGIPAEEQRHIFEPFFRGRRAVHDQVHGTGLGLSLAKKIVEAHGGSIRVRSEQGKGTEFIVRIPSMPAELQRERQNEPAHSIG